MADAFIQVAPDSTGKKMQTVENTISAEDVHAEAVVLVDQFGVALELIGGARSLPVQLYGYDYNNLVPKLVQTDGDGKIVLAPETIINANVTAAGVPSGIGKVEDFPSADADGGVPAMAIRKATPANTSDTDGDYEMLQMDGGKLWVKGPITDAELRATPLPVSGTVATGGLTDAQLRATAVPVSGPLTDAQLRATAVPVSGSFSLPTGAATEAKQDTQITDLGGVTETAPASDTASSGLNGRLQRIAQRITSFTALFPASIGRKTTAGSLSVTLSSDHDNVPVEDTNVFITIGETNTQIGANNVAAAASDTATSSLNGRLQRIAQRITSLIALIPASLGQKTKANSFAVTLASDSDTLPVVGAKPTTSTNSPTLFQNLGANATLNVKASAGNVFSLTCYNANAAARYLQLHNTATVPAGSAVPVFSFLVPPSGQIIIGTDFFTNEGCNFATGIAFAFSTARNIYTAATAGDQSTWIQYK